MKRRTFNMRMPCWRSSALPHCVLPRQQMTPQRRLHVHGPIRPMHEHKGIVARILEKLT